MSKDRLIIAAARNDEVRIHAARTTTLVESVRKAHDLYPTSCAALGRTMTVAGLMGSDLKSSGEQINIRIDGHGPLGAIVVQADGDGNVRGYVENPHVYMSREDGHLDVGGAVGIDGTLSVQRDMGLKEPFTGTVDLRTGEIGDDFAYYFALSEQTPSVVAVGVLVDKDTSVKAAGGMIIQLLPNASEETIEAVEEVLGKMKPMTSYMEEGLDPEDLIKMLFADARTLEVRDVRFACGCSKDGYARSLMTLKESDLDDMIREDHGAEVVCRWCGTKYHYSEEDLRAIKEQRTHGSEVENR